MAQINIGDFVTGYGSGYWQLIDIKPKIADEDYTGETVCWKKGEVIGQWAILKKGFTAKMKPCIDFSYEDYTWIKPVTDEIMSGILKYFAEHPQYRQKFDDAEVKLLPMITNCWMDLPEDKESDFTHILEKLPDSYTMDEFWEIAKDYKKYISNPPTKCLLNLSTYPWNMDRKANLLYIDCTLTKG